MAYLLWTLFSKEGTLPTTHAFTNWGSTLLNTGFTRFALRCFDAAAKKLPQIDASIEQKRGICLRMLKQYSPAEKAFESALDVATANVHCGQITRDWSRVPLAQGDIARASELIGQSLQYLQPSDTPTSKAEEERKRKIEYFVSLGFQGLVWAEAGQHALALQTFKQVRTELAGIAPYELNSIAMELQVAPFGDRLKLYPHALWLSLRALNAKRVVQVTLLTFCRPILRLIS